MPTREGPQVAFPGTAAVVDGSEAIASIATASDGVLDVTAVVKAMVPAPRHELTVMEVAR